MTRFLDPAATKRELPQKNRGAAQPGGGRPSVIEDPVFRQKFLEMVRAGNYIVVISRALGVHPSTINRWKHYALEGMEPFMSFMEEVKVVQAVAITKRVDQVNEAADKGIWQAAAWWLERKYPEMFGRARLDVAVRGSIDVEHNITIRKILADPEAVRLASQLVDSITSSPYGPSRVGVASEPRALGDGKTPPEAELLPDGGSSEEGIEALSNNTPRHGKSEFVSHYFPAWYLGVFPDDRVMLASYEAEFAASWGRKARDELETYGPKVFGVRVRHDSSAADRWDIADHHGGMVTAGVGGPITGRGANVFIIDDPIKNAEEANSEVYREKLWDWFISTARTRLEPKGAIIVLMARWNEDDIVGRLKKLTGSRWTELRMPAIAEEDDILGRQPGEPLWPERYSIEELKEIAADQGASGTYWWSSLYQQNPLPAKGAVFSKSDFRFFRESPDHYLLTTGETVKVVPRNRCIRFTIVDLAVLLKRKADWTVVGSMLLTPENDLLIYDVDRKKVEGTKHMDVLTINKQTWKPAFIGVEPAAYQLALIQTARSKGLPIRELEIDKDKLTRALYAQPYVEGGQVYLREGAPWVGTFLDEVCAFPNGAKDDQVDVLSFATYQIRSFFSMIRPISFSRSTGIRVHG